MKKKSNSKKLKLKINSLDDTLFKKLTDQELKEIKGGAILTGQLQATGALTLAEDC